MTEKVLCPAKINLFLEVTGKRKDGYHDIDTVFHSVDLCDTVRVEVLTDPSGENGIELTCGGGLPTDRSNIAYRAAESFLEKYGITGQIIKIDIEKRIPVAAGLAGGSTDCAGVLIALERIFSTGDREGLLDLGRTLGADVPFCILGGAARASGIGEKLSKLPPAFFDWTLVIAKGREGVSTAEAYRNIDSLPEREIRSADRLTDAYNRRDGWGVIDSMFNIFEKVSGNIGSVGRAKALMHSCGALGAMMSGSGPSVFGIFADPDSADNARRVLADEGFEAFVCRLVY